MPLEMRPAGRARRSSALFLHGSPAQGNIAWSIRRFRHTASGKGWGVQIVGLIVIGIVIGIIARLVLPGRQHIGALMTVLLGIGGALVGGIVASAIGEGDIFELNVIGTIVGVIAAVGLIAIAEALGVGDDRARRV
jgi:uncharacterized membrane protein YeaQ/YmgE (transglycosylase-associated protein family)